MQALRVDGTVLVEAALDATGHVEPGSAKIVQSPNHAFDEEALRVVRGSVYRPASSKGRVVRAVIRQAIAFVNY
jgi:TonB family protein